MRYTPFPVVRRCIVCLLALCMCAPVCPAADIFDQLSSLDKDAYIHFGAGVLVSHASYPVFLKYTRDRRKAMWYSLGLTVLLGAAKEAYDTRTTGFSGGDLAFDVLGGCTLVVVAF